MDDEATADLGPIHPNNRQLGVFTNPLPSSQLRGCIGTVSTSNDLHYYFTQKHGCKHNS